ncbi:MAG TPA: ABC transporter permease [Candidatus Avacidaminococcus intestinavium]|uniref:ABC transporter permease n=1 Tax=Candidatus Avacidaminococcus intestinavium TaxID=2840684 RepID=A0A9D1MQM6_9FIRM|nr:ABC transporter permease [Candidatus Avacidaminococcus intestinavium]
MLSTEDIAKQLITGSEDIIVTPEEIEAVRKELGLDQPFLVQFGNWVFNAVQGDFGFSYMAKKAVTDKIIECLPATLYLTATSLIIMLVVSIPLGIMSAVHRNQFIDYIVRIGAFLGASLPGFWVGLMLLWFFGLKLGWFPIISSNVGFNTVVLPALTLAIAMSAKYTRQVRSAVLDELNQDYVIGARARGMSEHHILYKEVLPNAILPLLTIFGLSMGSLLGGSAVVEIVFGWPGLGRLAVDAINYRDFKLLQGIVVWIAFMYMVINITIDLLYLHFNPIMRKKGNNDE